MLRGAKVTVTNLATGRVTYYFRTHFTLNVAPSTVTLQLSGIIDDSAIVYLNGQELERFGFADSTVVSFITLAERNKAPDAPKK